MKQTYIVGAIIVFGMLVAFTTPSLLDIVFKNDNTTYETTSSNALAGTTEKVNKASKVISNASNVDLAIANVEMKAEVKEEPKEEVKKEEIKVESTENVVSDQVKHYADMTVSELVNAISNGVYTLEYSNLYDTKANRLSKSKGALYYNNHKETYYSERVLPGTSLNIPGRHVALDGTVRDGDGYIAVAANSSYLSKGTVVKTSLGPGKVYDSGCASGVIDIYTNW